MLSRRHLLGVAALAIALLAGTAAAQEPATTPATPAAPPACADCHEQAAAFADGLHGKALARKGRAAELACASCHGDTAKHVESQGQEPPEYNGRGGRGAQPCLSCHEDRRGDRSSYRTGVHASGDAVACGTCHSIHAADKRAAHLLVKPNVALCGSCHPGPAASHKDKPYAHRIGRGGMDCATCHDPHGLPNRTLKLTRSDELPCLTCHADKRGPFVYEHVNGVTGTCLTCHEAHGSSNNKRLIRANVDQLCLECHSTLTAGLVGSQPPAFHNLSLPRYRNCTTCHVAVHGSNRDPALLK